MKRRIFLSCLLLTIALPLLAQKGMAIDQLFDGRYKDRQGATEVLVKGRKLQPYGLTLFRSLTLRPSKAEMLHIEQLVLTDARHASDKDTDTQNGRLFYGFYGFPPANGHYRYLFYRNNGAPTGRLSEVTVVYMEGTATAEQLKRMFSK